MRAAAVSVVVTLALGGSLTPGGAHPGFPHHYHALDMQHGGQVMRPGVTAP